MIRALAFVLLSGAVGTAFAGSGYTPPVDASAIGAQPLDSTLTAFSGASCVADRVLYCSGNDAVTSGTLTAAGRALLDDANAAAQLVTLGAGALCTGSDAGDVPYTPAAGADWTNPDPAEVATGLDDLAGRVTALEGGGGGATCGAYDWADPCYETGSDQLTTIDAAAWSDAATALGAAASTCEAAFASRLLRADGGYAADCSTAHGATARTDGLLTAVAGGDFSVLIRVGWRRSVAPGTASFHLENAIVFVDGADDDAAWYGFGANFSNHGDADLPMLPVSRAAGASAWEATTYGSGFTIYTPVPTWDVQLVRVGTTLTIYWAPTRGSLLKVATYTVTAGAGWVGLRMGSDGSSADYTIGTIHAYRTSLSGVP